MSNDTYNVNSKNQTGGITAGKINITTKAPSLSEQEEEVLLNFIKKEALFDLSREIIVRSSDQNSYHVAGQIVAFLRKNNLLVAGPEVILISPPIKGIECPKNSNIITVGYFG